MMNGKRTMRARVAVAALFLGPVGLACSDSPTGTDCMVDSGSWYRTGFRWPHDCNPYESPHFIVYSDAASQEARQKVAEIAEELLVMLKEDFDISGDTLFLWPAGQSKIHIYTYRDHYEQAWGGWGYYGGLLIWSLDHPIRNTELGNYTRVVTHELMHVVEGLLKGTDNPRLVDVWLTEGIAEYVAGGTSSSGSITSVAMLDSLVASRGELNPIAMHRYENYPDVENIGYLYFYAMFELGAKYLVDPGGLGRPKSMIRDVYLDARNGALFATSFEEKFGLSLLDYEDEFWDRVRVFLN